MSRVVWLLKNLQALKMAEETMTEEMVEETKLETHTRVQSAYIKIWWKPGQRMSLEQPLTMQHQWIIIRTSSLCIH